MRRPIVPMHFAERIIVDPLSSPYTPSPQQQSLIERIRAVLQADARIEAAWLSGSLGKGQGDRWSDVDVLVLAADGQAGAVSAGLARDLSPIATPVLVNSLYGGRVLNVVTENWERFDLSFAEGAELGFHDGAGLTPLFNRGNRAPQAKPAAAYVPGPAALRSLVEEFLRVSGLAVLGAGREEYVVMLSGVELLRRMTLDLMLEENGVPPAARGGALRRNPFLTEAQRRDLEAAPPLTAERESLLAANLHFARLFLPRARDLGRRIDMEWPTALEDATRRHLKRHLGFELP